MRFIWAMTVMPCEIRKGRWLRRFDVAAGPVHQSECAVLTKAASRNELTRAFVSEYKGYTETCRSLPRGIRKINEPRSWLAYFGFGTLYRG